MITEFEISSQLKFDKTSKGLQNSKCQENLMSNKNLVSIESEVVCTERLKSLLESINSG